MNETTQPTFIRRNVTVEQSAYDAIQTILAESSMSFSQWIRLQMAREVNAYTSISN